MFHRVEYFLIESDNFSSPKSFVIGVSAELSLVSIHCRLALDAQKLGFGSKKRVSFYEINIQLKIGIDWENFHTPPAVSSFVT